MHNTNPSGTVSVLPYERWSEIEPMLLEHFDGVLPAAEEAVVLCTMDENGKIESFCILEMLIRIGQIYRVPGTRSVPIQEFFRYAVANAPKDSSVIAIASEPRFEPICRKYGMRKVEGVVYRRDF